MNAKKILPVILLVIMAVATFMIRRCNESKPARAERQTERKDKNVSKVERPVKVEGKLDRTTKKLFFTKHARCRMKCRHITQKEVRDILVNGKINYNKSELNDAKGPTYAVEGLTADRQHVRIIFAPKQEHLTVVTVIDLEVEYECDCS